jgi:hypothetical protein
MIRALPVRTSLPHRASVKTKHQREYRVFVPNTGDRRGECEYTKDNPDRGFRTDAKQGSGVVRHGVQEVFDR